MRFYMKTGSTQPMDKAGKFVGEQAIRIETNSLHPRTNRKWIRRVLREAFGVKPQYIKYVMKTMNFWTPEDLGIPCGYQRNQLYLEALQRAKDSESES